LAWPVGLPQQLPSELALTNFPSPTLRKIGYGRAGWKGAGEFHASARGVHLACLRFLDHPPA